MFAVQAASLSSFFSYASCDLVVRPMTRQVFFVGKDLESLFGKLHMAHPNELT